MEMVIGVDPLDLGGRREVLEIVHAGELGLVPVAPVGDQTIM
jgi:hypothetical protein